MSLATIDQLALRMLQDDQTILDTAREISSILQRIGVAGGVVGGIAVFLHGYRRTTTDIDVYCVDRSALGDALKAAGYVWDDAERQFMKGDVPVQLLAPQDRLGFDPTHFQDLEGVQAVSLADLISMKLASGTGNVHRMNDLSDIVRLAHANKIDKSFTPKIAPEYRKEFKVLMDRMATDPKREF
ncbi:MAG: hypothetical protein AAF750_12235 [Planctomycetota bacterium]